MARRSPRSGVAALIEWGGCVGGSYRTFASHGVSITLWFAVRDLITASIAPVTSKVRSTGYCACPVTNIFWIFNPSIEKC
eukprot:COSAG01_NODE_60753_length_293_cov_0.675258_1_plen_79_part_10